LVARHLQGKLEKQLERNFERTNQLDEDEGKEWVALVEKRKRIFFFMTTTVSRSSNVFAISQHSGYLVLNRRKTRCGHVSRYLNAKGLL
jgi:hypothetical protein